MIGNRKAYIRKHFWGVRPFKRHSLILVVAGFSYMLTGLTYILANPTLNRKIALQIALSVYPIEFWGSFFVLVGLLASLSSRWPPVTEKWGYSILAGLSAGWSATYAAGVLFGNSPISNLTACLQWGLLAFLWIAIPGLVNPDKTVVVVINDNRTDN